MGRADSDRAQELFREALRLSPEGRARFLVERCADESLRRRVADLLRHDARASGFLEPPARGGDSPQGLPDALESGTSIGRFRIESRLGVGGMGSVYLATVMHTARGLAAGERVAMKIVHPHLFAREGFFARFLREAEVGRLVRHENVVRVIGADAIEQDGRVVHVLIMEYVEGRTLRQMREQLGTVPEALLREIAAQVAAGVAAIHARGVVHRDLKPENVLVTDDHRVCVMDLGVAHVTADSSPLTNEGEFVGSLAYAAPEQYRRDGIGPAADLYSLGVLLYELATGTNPFRFDEAPKTIAAHLRDVPQPAIDVNPEVSPFLSELVRTLLEKEPGRRIESAERLHALLREGEASEWWTERRARLTAGRVPMPRVSVRRETALYGREGDLELLRSCWERVREGDGNAVLVEGEAGIGKTRLVDTFLREAASPEVRILYGSYPPAGGLGGLSDALTEHFGAAGLEAGVAPFLAGTRSVVPAFAALVRHERPPEGAPALAGDALHAVFCNLMRALAAERPLVWVIDDLHFASEEGRAIAISLARAVAGHPVLLLLTSRQGLPEGDVAHLGKLENFRRIALARLGAREVVQLLRDAFRSEVLADKLAGKIAYKSDGVPFFVFEMIRGLREGQFITQLPDGTWVETRVIEQIEVPSAVRDLIEARLRDLTREERAILDVGAVDGFEFDPDLVARVLERRRIHVLQDLAALERRSGVVRSDRGVTRFDHHQIQEVLYADLIPDLRVEYHAAIAAALEARESARPSGVTGGLAAKLARHFLQGEQGERGLPYVAPALEHHEQQYEHGAAIDLARLVLDAPGLLTGRARAETLLELARRLRVTGRRGEERTVLDEALETSLELGDAALVARVRLGVGGLLHLTGAHEEARAELRAALAAAREASDRVKEAEAQRLIATAYLHDARFAEATRHAELSAAIHRELADRRGEARVRHILGHLEQRQGRIDAAREHHEAALAIGRELGDRLTQATAIGNLGNVLHAEGRFAEAVDATREQLAIMEEIGNRHGVALATANWAMSAADAGEVDEAIELARRGMRLAREVGDAALETGTLRCLAGCYHASGRLAESLLLDEEVLARSREADDRFEEAVTSKNVAETYMLLGRLANARPLALRSRDLTESVSREDTASVTALLGRMAYREGDLDQAQQLLREAVRGAREVGNAQDTARALTRLGEVLEATGATAEAREALTEAFSCGGNAGEGTPAVVAAAHLARLGAIPASEAAELLEAGETRLDPATVLEAHFQLWRATSDARHLGHAHTRLEHLRRHAPEEYRDSMIENVPLHRDIMAAWREHGGSESETVVST